MAKEKKNQSEMEQYEEYILLKKGAEAELVEKKSRFIATLCPVSSEEEALAFIGQLKKKILGCQAQLLCLCNRS